MKDSKSNNDGFLKAAKVILSNVEPGYYDDSVKRVLTKKLLFVIIFLQRVDCFYFL